MTEDLNVPAVKEGPDPSRFPPLIGKIIEKIKRRGSESLTDEERIMVVQIFRGAAMTSEKRLTDVKNAIQQAHLEYCFRLEGMR
jgi:hypothetical protein